MSEQPMTERAAEALNDDFERDLHTEHQILNMGPSHPATHGTVKFLIELDGETIVNLDVQVGYLHRGFEKECESGTWYQAVPYTDRLNYNSAILMNQGFCLAVEKMLKAHMCRATGDLAPRKHPLLRLAERTGLVFSSDWVVDRGSRPQPPDDSTELAEVFQSGDKGVLSYSPRAFPKSV